MSAAVYEMLVVALLQNSTYGDMPVTCPNPSLGGLSIADVCPTSSITYLLAGLNMMVAYHPTINDPCNHVRPTLRPSDTYDFIVVGGKTEANVRIRG